MYDEQLADGVRLICGDCREVLPSLKAGSVDMIWTDPPYGNGNHDGDWNARLNEYRGRENQPIANDDFESMRKVVDAMLTQAARLLNPAANAVCCCCSGGGGPLLHFAWLAERMNRDGLEFFHSVVWDKLNPGLGWRYRRQYELVMVAHRTGSKLAWNDECGAVANVYQEMPAKERQHPNEKPIGLGNRFLAHHSLTQALILDPFVGCGTTGVAAVRAGRRFIGVELEQKYFDIARRRITDALAQTDLFFTEPPPAVQLELRLKPEPMRTATAYIQPDLFNAA